MLGALVSFECKTIDLEFERLNFMILMLMVLNRKLACDYGRLIRLRVDFQCRVIFTCVRA